MLSSMANMQKTAEKINEQTVRNYSNHYVEVIDLKHVDKTPTKWRLAKIQNVVYCLKGKAGYLLESLDVEKKRKWFFMKSEDDGRYDLKFKLFLN